MKLRKEIDILVIGGGQAGLVMGYHLKSQPHEFQVLERRGRIGDSWRVHYDSLKLFSPRAFSALPGLPVPLIPTGSHQKTRLPIISNDTRGISIFRL